MNNEVLLGNVIVDCDDEKKLQKFYGALLGWEMCEMYNRPAVRRRCLIRPGIRFVYAGSNLTG